MTLELNKHTRNFIYSEVHTSSPFQFESQRWRTEKKRTTVSEYVACNSHTKANRPSSPTSTSTSNPDLDASSLAPTDLVSKSINQSYRFYLFTHSFFTSVNYPFEVRDESRGFFFRKFAYFIKKIEKIKIPSC